MNNFVYCAVPVPLGNSAGITPPLDYSLFKTIKGEFPIEAIVDHFITQQLNKIEKHYDEFKKYHADQDFEKANNAFKSMYEAYVNLGPAFEIARRKYAHLNNLFDVFDAFSDFQVHLYSIFNQYPTFKHWQDLALKNHAHQFKRKIEDNNKKYNTACKLKDEKIAEIEADETILEPQKADYIKLIREVFCIFSRQLY